MTDVQKIDHVKQGLSLLPSQWEDKPIIRGVLTSYLEQLNRIEDDAIAVRDAFNVETAVGRQLDIIGEYFYELRFGRTDEDYRQALLSKIASSNGSGTPDEMLNLYSGLTGTPRVEIWEHYPHGTSLLAVGGYPVKLGTHASMEKANAAGVEFVGLLVDEFDLAWRPRETTRVLSNVISTPPAKNLIMNTDSTDHNVVAEFDFDPSISDLSSSFVDMSLPEPDEVGYGVNYGAFYGGSNTHTSVFVEASIEGNPLTPAGGNGMVEWASLDERDEFTKTTNKAKPKRQLQDSGLKRLQPLARQFFNWMMANIDDWLSHIYNRTPIGCVILATDGSTTAAKLGELHVKKGWGIDGDTTLFGTTWEESASIVDYTSELVFSYGAPAVPVRKIKAFKRIA